MMNDENKRVRAGETPANPERADEDLLLMLHLTKNTLKEWCSEGGLKCSRIKNKTYFLRQDIERFLYNHYQTYKP